MISASAYKRVVSLPGARGCLSYCRVRNGANQCAFYQRWAELMNARTWADVPHRCAPRYAGRPTR